MGGGVLLLFFIDFLYTTALAIGASWFYVSRYLTRRTPSQMGKGDVQLLRAMRDELRMLEQMDEMNLITLPAKNRDRIRALVTTHDQKKELPS